MVASLRYRAAAGSGPGGEGEEQKLLDVALPDAPVVAPASAAEIMGDLLRPTSTNKKGHLKCPNFGCAPAELVLGLFLTPHKPLKTKKVVVKTTFFVLGWSVGLEPTTLGTTIQCSAN